MLHHMCFKNFVHFKEHQTLKFQPGINILVGQNSSGKTSILEMIRRCMTKRINNHVTSSYDETREAYLVCKFDITSYYGELLHSLDKQPAVQQLGDGQDSMYLLSIVQKIPFSGRVTWKKSVCFRRDDKVTVLVGYYNVENDNILSSDDNVEFFYGKIDSLWMLENDDWVTDNERQIIQDLSKIDAKYAKNAKRFTQLESSSKLLDEVLEVIEKRYVSTTPMRSINPVQWSRSRQKSFDESVNCKEAVERAEILQTLLNNEEEVDCKRADEIFEEITRPLVYKFSKTDSNIIIKHKNDNPPETKRVPLLKTPEGIIEAQQLALLLAHKEFKTLCFEEPDRGMHPKMIEQLLQALTEETNKTFLVVTHSPYFINSMTAKLTHVCVRRRDDDSVKSVHSVQRLLENDKTCKITDTDELKKIVFSSQILCVEGKTDKIFVQAIFEHMKTEGMKSIPAHQIIAMNSHTLFQQVQSLCESLNVKCVVLLDRDAIVRLQPTGKGKGGEGAAAIKKLDQIIKKIRLKGITREENENILQDWEGKSLQEFERAGTYETLFKILDNKDIFIWKNGNLEETIRSVFTGNSFMETFKTELEKLTICTFDKGKLSTLAKEMCKSDEIQRFLNFFKSKERGDKTKEIITKGPKISKH